MKPPLQKLIAQTKIIHFENHFRKLQIAEAVSITSQRPTINIQQAADFILPSARAQPPDPQQEPRTPRPTAQHQHLGPVTRAATLHLSQTHPAANENTASQTHPTANEHAASQASPAANENAASQAGPAADGNATSQADLAANEN